MDRKGGVSNIYTCKIYILWYEITGGLQIFLSYWIKLMAF